MKRKADGFICALKYIEPKNDKDRNIVLNEIALMQMCSDPGMLQVIEAFDFKNRFWIFVELMDDAMTGFVQNCYKAYSENVCKYVLYKTLCCLKYLHDRGVIHRDIKSDNVLMTVEGDVKLADFGYAC